MINDDMPVYLDRQMKQEILQDVLWLLEILPSVSDLSSCYLHCL